VTDLAPAVPRTRPEIAHAIDALLARKGLPPRDRFLVLAGAAVARGESIVLETTYRAAFVHGVSFRALSEIVLQTHLFAGYPRAINALTLLVAVAERAGVARDDFLEGGPAPETVRARGEELCRLVYGDGYDRLRRYMQSLHPDFDAWMLEVGYGRVLGRPALPAPVRELAAVGALIVLNVPKQLRAHLSGARNAGASLPAIDETVWQGGFLAAPDAAASAQAVWADARRA